MRSSLRVNVFSGILQYLCCMLRERMRRRSAASGKKRAWNSWESGGSRPTEQWLIAKVNKRRGLLEIKYVFNLTTLHCTDSLQQYLHCYLGNKVWLLYLPSLFSFQPTVLHLWFWMFELLSLKKSIFHQVEVVNISNKWKNVWWIFSQSLH